MLGKHTRTLPALLTLAFTAIPGLLFAQTKPLSPPNMVKAQLVSEQTAVVPGQSFTVGLHLDHKKGWHTYWENPGDVGIPPMFKWKLPDGWTAGPVQYQAPQRVKMFDITAHGFSGTTALHLVELTPPAKLKGSKVTLAADITWMLCGRSCHPGTYPFALELPVAGSATAKAKPNPRWRKAFDAVRAEHPRPSTSWIATALNETKDTILLELRPRSKANRKAPATAPLFYGLDKQVFSDRPHHFNAKPAEAPPGTLQFRLPRTDYGPKDKAELEAVLHRPDGWLDDGSLRYLRITAAFGPLGSGEPKHFQTIPRQGSLGAVARTPHPVPRTSPPASRNPDPASRIPNPVPRLPPPASRTVRFSAIGCGPYAPADVRAIRHYLAVENQKIGTPDAADFFIHLGDINSGKDAREGKVGEASFINIRDLLTRGNKLSTYIVPGDNEWNDMPDPDQAWRWWFAHLQHLNECSSPPWTTARQHARPENFAFRHHGVLFIGINLPGGKVHNEAEWQRRFRQNNEWIGEQLSAHGGSVRAAVVFFQANLIGAGKIKEIVAKRFQPFCEGFEPHATAFEKPLLLLHADGHKWLKDRPFANAKNVLRVQVDLANPKFPPLRVTIPAQPDPAKPDAAFQFDRRLDDPVWTPPKNIMKLDDEHAPVPKADAKRARLEAELAKWIVRIETAKAVKAKKGKLFGDPPPDFVRNSPLWAPMSRELQKKKVERDAKLLKFGPRHRDVVGLTSQIATLERNIEAMADNIIQVAQPKIVAVKRQIEALDQP